MKNKIWIVWIFCIKMALQLISIPGCDNKSSTIFIWPSEHAKNSGVQLNEQIKFQKWL